MFSEPLLAHPASVAEFTPHSHLHAGVMTTAIKRIMTPTMNSVWFSPRRFSSAHNDPDTRKRDCLCAYAQGPGRVNSGRSAVRL